MSVFDNRAKDDLELEIRNFLEEHTITELLEVVIWNVEEKENDMLDKLKGEQK